MPMRLSFRFIAAIAAACLSLQPAAAQSILRDAETEALLRDMAAPLISAAGLDPRNVDIVLVGDNSVNAFVAGGQAVYVNSGLVNEASSANEVQGVIAHEPAAMPFSTAGRKRRAGLASCHCCSAQRRRQRAAARQRWVC